MARPGYTDSITRFNHLVAICNPWEVVWPGNYGGHTFVQRVDLEAWGKARAMVAAPIFKVDEDAVDPPIWPAAIKLVKALKDPNDKGDGDLPLLVGGPVGHRGTRGFRK